MNEQTKQCPKCKETKPYSEFWKCKTHSDGLQIYCKICQGAFNKKNYSLSYFQQYRAESLASFRTTARINGVLKRNNLPSMKHYGITKDFLNEIETHVGACPNPEEYDLDHIFPASCFNLQDPVEVLMYCLPDNHCWLPKNINRWMKRNGYDTEALALYKRKATTILKAKYGHLLNWIETNSFSNSKH